jgi:hypothetical protein
LRDKAFLAGWKPSQDALAEDARLSQELKRQQQQQQQQHQRQQQQQQQQAQEEELLGDGVDDAKNATFCAIYT